MKTSLTLLFCFKTDLFIRDYDECVSPVIMSHSINSLWSSDEEAELIAQSSSGIPIYTIAKQHGRTPRAIQLRLERIALRHLLAGMPVAEVLRITGIPPPKTAQTSVKTDSHRVIPVIVQPMFAHTLSRASLQAAPAERRLDAIRCFIEGANTGHAVKNAAALGKTSYLVAVPKDNRSGAQCHPPPYIVTPADILEGLKAKFPGCDVELHEEWVDVRPGVREQRSGIRIDWS
jgi:hypothetical protein